MSSNAPVRAVRLAWTAFIVQAVALLFHQSWHAVGFDEPPGDVGHYLLLHLPLHIGVVLLGAASIWLVVTRRTSPPLLLLATGASVQHAGMAVDVAAVFGNASHVAGALLLAGGGAVALGAPLVRRVLAARGDAGKPGG